MILCSEVKTSNDSVSSERRIHFARLGVRNICLPEGLLRAATHIMQKMEWRGGEGLVFTAL